jgi:signal transduction histidine kinase
MKTSLRTKLLWGHLVLFLAGSSVSVLITWMEFEIDGFTRYPPFEHWRPILVAAAASCVPVFLLTLASWWFTRRCLTPVVKLTQAAEGIREDNLHESLELNGSGDELDRLAAVLNEMMQRLDGSFQRVCEFTLHASHELKTPLTILMAGFEKALLEPDLGERYRTRLLEWLRELERLNRIVSGLTLLTQGDAHQVELNLEPLDLAELAADSAAEAEILGQHLALKVRVHSDDSYIVSADRNRLRQLLLNLTDNAVKFNREGGHIEYRVFQDGHNACVDVCSGGRGIDAEELPHIFGRFFRSSTSRGTVSEGCGLGLSIARWIAEEHGGTLTATSQPDNTVLSLRLPSQPPISRPPHSTSGVAGRLTSLVGAIIAGHATFSAGAVAEPVLSYNLDVRPILAARCFSCHGADEKARKAGLRLDLQDKALESGAIVPGDPEGSTVIQRAESPDSDEIMPPPGKHDPLSPAQIAVLKSWIAQGARYERHWSFERVPQEVLPPATATGDLYSQIDGWVAVHHQRLGLEMAPPAAPLAWLKRAALDLTGLPAAAGVEESFVHDLKIHPDLAKRRAVDRLLASPAFGERLANDWLDAARYADTYGRHEDATCTTWPYRDWVIKVFNENLPYNQFVTWQLAGDLLPEATDDQRVATCFLRLAQQSNEAGSNPEEFRIEQVADRLHTTATAFLGLTMECARCHDHKYDPLTMRDYYSLAAFLNNIDELGLFTVFTGAAPPPALRLLTAAEKAEEASIREQIARQEETLVQIRGEARGRFTNWLTQFRPPGIEDQTRLWGRLGSFFSRRPPAAAPRRPEAFYRFDELQDKELLNDGTLPERGMVSLNAKLMPGRHGMALRLLGDNSVNAVGLGEVRRSETFSFAIWVRPLEWMKRAVITHRSRAGVAAACRGFELVLDDMCPSFALVHFSPGNEIRVRAPGPIPLDTWTHLACVYDGSSRADGLELFINGERVETEMVRDQLSRDIVYRPEWGDEKDKDGIALRTVIGGRFHDGSFHNGMVDDFAFFSCKLTLPEVRQLAGLPDDSPPEAWFDWYLREQDEPWRLAWNELGRLRAKENDLSERGVEVMVMQERPGPRRLTHILERGCFDQPGVEVAPDTPAFLPPFPEGAPRNRLGLAQWMVSPENPLVSRVAVNRLWQMFFGRGLTATSEDFGTQGSLPDHPRLLDWLAAHFVKSGWDVKSLCREIVLSKTYSQDTMPLRLEMLEQDPDNVHLARGPGRRMTAEQVRDWALATSGLLAGSIGGPSVYPYQPANLWDDAGTQHNYPQSKGEGLFRRSLYTFWRRTMPPANMTLFDAPSREFCVTRRDRTNTPQQALVLMNDPQLLEAARHIALRALRGGTSSDAIAAAFYMLLRRQPEVGEMRLLEDYFQAELARFESDPAATATLLEATGSALRPDDLAPPSVAAATLLARLLFSFSETTMIP